MFGRKLFLLFLFAVNVLVSGHQGEQRNSLEERASFGTWEWYTDEVIDHATGRDGNAHIDRASIVTLDGDTLTSPDYPKALRLSAMEGFMVSTSFDEDFRSYFPNGVKAEGILYHTLVHETPSVLRATGAESGGLFLQKTERLVIVVHYPQEADLGVVRNAVQLLAEQLESEGL